MQRTRTNARPPRLPARRALKSYFFPVDLTPEKDGRWTADVPLLPGCVTWGQTREEALRHAQEAIELYIADVIDAGDTLPGGIFVAETPTISVTV